MIIASSYKITKLKKFLDNLGFKIFFCILKSCYIINDLYFRNTINPNKSQLNNINILLY